MTLPPFDLVAWVREHAPVNTEAPPEPQPRPCDSRRVTSGGNGRKSPLERFVAYVTSPGFPEAIEGQRGHSALFHAACEGRDGFGLERNELRQGLSEYNRTKAHPPESDKQIDHKVDQAIRKFPNPSLKRLNAPPPESKGHRRDGKESGNGSGHHHPDAGPERRESEGRPTILVTERIHEAVDQSLEVLAGIPNVFQRGPMIVHVVRDVVRKKRNDINRPPNSPRILGMPMARLREVLTRAADFKKQKKTRAGDWEIVPTVPPDHALAAILARAEWADIPPIEGIVEAPTLRRDGSILDTPGWDEASGLLYEPAIDFPPIKANPTREDAKAASELLLDLVFDFPFVDESHKAAWLAALLTVLARFAISGPVPFFLFDANTPGAGKTLLMDTISIIATARNVARAAFPDDDDEMRKLLLAIALAGDLLLLFDNVPTGFGIGGPALDGALTGTSLKGRILGRSEVTGDVPWSCILMATGNNLGLKGDALRRVVLSRLESPEIRPEERTDFRIPDLLSHVQRERANLVVAGLTILRAFVVAGRPEPETKLVSMDYRAWSGLIRNAVHWATGEDPCGP